MDYIQTYFQHGIVGGVGLAFSKTLLSPFVNYHIVIMEDSSRFRKRSTSERIKQYALSKDAFRGNLKNIIRNLFGTFCSFGFFGMYEYNSKKSNSNHLSYIHFWNAFLTGISSQLVISTVERARKYAESKSIIKPSTTLNKPFGSYLLATETIINRSIYFGLFPSLHPKHNLTRFFAAWFTTALAGLVPYPLYTVRRRMNRKEDSGWKIFKDIIKEEGVKKLYHYAHEPVRRSISGALVLFFYDWVRRNYPSLL